MTASSWARAYLGVQALAGAAWWVAVAASADVRRWTLGGWDPWLVAGPDLVLFVGASALAAWRANRVVAAIVAAWSALVTVALAAHGLTEQTAGPGVALMVLATIGSSAAASVLWLGRLPTDWFFVGPFAVRVAREGTGGRHLRRSLAQLVVFWTAFFVVIPLVLATAEERLGLGWPFLDQRRWDVIGAGTFGVASVVGLWACATMALRGEGTPLPAETARYLVVLGPYRCVRNPMAVAGVLQTAGIGLWHGSWIVVAIAVAGALAWDQIIRPVEEDDLARRFGAPYERYRAAVRCWIPSRPWPGSGG